MGFERKQEMGKRGGKGMRRGMGKRYMRSPMATMTMMMAEDMSGKIRVGGWVKGRGRDEQKSTKISKQGERRSLTSKFDRSVTARRQKRRMNEDSKQGV